MDEHTVIVNRLPLNCKLHNIISKLDCGNQLREAELVFNEFPAVGGHVFGTARLNFSNSSDVQRVLALQNLEIRGQNVEIVCADRLESPNPLNVVDGTNKLVVKDLSVSRVGPLCLHNNFSRFGEILYIDMHFMQNLENIYSIIEFRESNSVVAALEAGLEVEISDKNVKIESLQGVMVSLEKIDNEQQIYRLI